MLDEARQARATLRPLPAEVAPRDAAEGAAVQHALAARLGIGQPAGFKIGATGTRMQAYLGLPGPAAGFVASADLHASGVTLTFADYLKPGVECELAVRLAHDLPPGPCTRAQAAAAVGALFAAIELVENRYGDIAVLGTPTLIGDQVYQAAAVAGADAADWRTLDLPAIRGRIALDFETRDEGIGAELLGHPMEGLAWLAASPVAAAFGGLCAGQVVLLGSVTPPIWLDGPCRVTVSFPPLPPVDLFLT